jgi:hypothetical protein
MTHCARVDVELCHTDSVICQRGWSSDDAQASRAKIVSIQRHAAHHQTRVLEAVHQIQGPEGVSTSVVHCGRCSDRPTAFGNLVTGAQLYNPNCIEWHALISDKCCFTSIRRHTLWFGDFTSLE